MINARETQLMVAKVTSFRGEGTRGGCKDYIMVDDSDNG